MTVFFTCIILIGSSVVVFALFLLLAEKRRLYDYRQDAREKKDDLIKVIEDAELLIDEMNKFSDFVVSNLEQKHIALTETIHEADLRIETLNGAVDSLPVAETDPDKNTVRSIRENPVMIDQDIAYSIDSQLLKKGKVVPFDVKRREIIKLSKSGLNSTQIARLLNMGKGEIELIAKVGR